MVVSSMECNGEQSAAQLSVKRLWIL